MRIPRLALHPTRRHASATRWAGAAWVAALAILLASCAATRPPASPGNSSAGAGVSPVVPTPITIAPTPTPVAPSASSDTASVAATPAATPQAALPTPGVAFTLLRMASRADPASTAPDATTFVSSYGSRAPTMFVVFALRPGLAGTVTCTIDANGVRTAGPISLAYGPTNSWGDFRITSRGTFATGSYRATVVFVPTGESATVDFTVH